MAIDYAKLQATALRLLTQNGQAITFSYETEGDINPATGAGSEGDTITVAGVGVASRYKNMEIDGTVILASDLKLICNNVATEPQPQWRVSVNSKIFTVLDVMPVNPAGQNIIYICQLRI